MFNLLNNSFPTIIKHLLTVEIQMPLGYLIVKTLMVFFGSSTFVLRSYSFIFLILISFAFYRLLCLKEDKATSLRGVSLLLLFHPLFLYSSSMRPYLAMIFFTIMSLFYFIKLKESPTDNFKKENIFFYVYLILLAITHPTGLFLAVTLAIVVIKDRITKNNFLKFVFCIALLFAALFIFRMNDIIYLFRDHINFNRVVIFLKNLSFLTSGVLFSLALLCMFFYLIIFKNKHFYKLLSDYRMHFILILIPIIIGSIFSFLLINAIYPRHFLFCLPSIAILINLVLNKIASNNKVRYIVFAILICSLVYKSIFKEKIQSQPYEIDSVSISRKAIDLSTNENIIVSCGNCFDYYIKNKTYVCLDSYNQYSKFKIDHSELIFIFLDYSQSLCNLDLLFSRYSIIEKYNFKGATIFKLNPKVNQL